MKTTVIYHSADFDGIFCRQIAKHFIPDADLIGWDFGDPPIEFPPDGKVYVLDLPPDQPFGWKEVPASANDRLIWIDHHASTIKKYPCHPTGYQIDGVAACRLAWQWFTAAERSKQQAPGHEANQWFWQHYPWPPKQHFIDRAVLEPLAVCLAGEYDVWDKRDPRAEEFQFGLRSREITGENWSELLSDMKYGTGLMDDLLRDGKMLQSYQQRMDAEIVRARSFLLPWEGLTFLALTTARCNSLTFAALDVPETGHDALMGFCRTAKGWTVSLYHAKHRTDLDLSTIATKFGGGGHRGACRFQCQELPFLSSGPDPLPTEAPSTEFTKELEHLINRCSIENGSNTPDFILAEFLSRCTEAWNLAVTHREMWYGRTGAPIPTGEAPTSQKPTPL